jgi:hypothetical protein
LTSTGQTTNENSKWGDIKQWYKKEQKRYNQAVKDGKVIDVVPPPSSQHQQQQQHQESGTTLSVAKAELISSEDDGDVTCTPSIVGGSSKGKGPSTNDVSNIKSKSSSSSLGLHKNDKERDEYIDPGPIPKNEYDNGFIENWKEVFFPLSLRKDAMTRGGYTKVRPRQAPAQPPNQQQPQQRRSSSDNPQSQQSVKGSTTPPVPVVMEGTNNTTSSNVKTKST